MKLPIHMIGAAAVAFLAVAMIHSVIKRILSFTPAIPALIVLFMALTSSHVIGENRPNIVLIVADE